MNGPSISVAGGVDRTVVMRRFEGRSWSDGAYKMTFEATQRSPYPHRSIYHVGLLRLRVAIVVLSLVSCNGWFEPLLWGRRGPITCVFVHIQLLSFNFLPFFNTYSIYRINVTYYFFFYIYRIKCYLLLWLTILVILIA